MCLKAPTMSRGSKRFFILTALGCAALRAVVTAWLCGIQAVPYLLVGLGGAATVPRLVGSYSAFPLAISLSPGILFLYLQSDYIPETLRAESTLALPRVASRRRWAASRCLRLALRVALYELASLALLTSVIALFGDSAFSLNELAASALSVLIDGFFCTALSLAINLVSLKRDALFGFATIIGAHLATVLCLTAIPAGFAKVAAPWLVSAHGIPAWHREICEMYGISADAAANINPAFSVALLLALSIALSKALARAVDRFDLI